MRHARKNHVAVAGTLLIALVLFGSASTSQAQGDSWLEIADMPTGRLGLATSVVDGKILAIGGYPSANVPGLPTVEEFDPETDTWTTKRDMPTGRRWLAASAVDDKIYAIGGGLTGPSGPPVAVVEEFDPSMETWTTKTPMTTERFGLSSSVVNGRIYAIGGTPNGSRLLKTVEEYDPATDSWSSKADMPTARGLFSTSVVDGKIYAIGGLTSGRTTGAVEQYDPAADTWTTKASMPTARAALSTAAFDGKIYAIGGRTVGGGSTALSVVEEYDPVTDSWTARTSMSLRRYGLSASAVDGEIYALGGATSTFAPHPGVRTVQAYSPLSLVLPQVLQAGDADQDLDFDQLDLVQVQVASKYRSGQAATWGEGDWDGAPGGQPGDPPTGNGLFDQFDVIAAQLGAFYLTGPYSAIQANGVPGDDQTSVIYNAGNGEVAVDAPAGIELTSINIDSAAGIFTGQAAQNLGGSFDNDADGSIFKATFGSSFGSLNFGNVAQVELSEEFVLGDLTVIGSLAGGGDLGEVDLVYIPEPSASLLLILGAAIGLLRCRGSKNGQSTQRSRKQR